MRPESPVCDIEGVQEHRRKNMKTTNMEKKATREIRTSRGGRRAQSAAPRIARLSLKAAADRQIAEIERTFTLRYEW
jgi:hypothetical protein